MGLSTVHGENNCESEPCNGDVAMFGSRLNEYEALGKLIVRPHLLCKAT